jgi:uncharacterized protein (DUF952 family)
VVSGGADAVIFHLALADEWQDVVSSGRPYGRSTIDQTLEEVGFVHCARAEQVKGVVERYYAGRTGVVVLTVDPARLESELRMENASGGTEFFPHVYGPLTPAAVVAVTPLGEFLVATTGAGPGGAAEPLP